MLSKLYFPFPYYDCQVFFIIKKVHNIIFYTYFHPSFLYHSSNVCIILCVLSSGITTAICALYYHYTVDKQCSEDDERL